MKTLFLMLSIILYITAVISNTESSEALEFVEDIEAENVALEEISRLQKQQLDEEIELQNEAARDASIALEAEEAAKNAETAKAAAEAAMDKNKKTESSDDLDWVRRSRPGSEAKPGANLKHAKTNSESRTNEERKDRGRIPDTQRKSGGSYFGESKKDQEKAVKAAEEARKAKETDGISAGAGNRRREVEGKLSVETRARASAASARRAEEKKEQQDWLERAKVSRRYASPVERVIRASDSDLYSPSRYLVLGVRRGAEEDEIKKAYRNAALKVHPDKNPHPDAKPAFDAIQEAFETLSSPLKRAQHDEELERRRAAFFARFSAQKIRKFVLAWSDNLASWVLLMNRNLREEGGLQRELDALKDKFERIVQLAKRRVTHFQLLPSAEDKLLLLTEYLLDRKTLIAAGIFILMSLK